MAALPVTQDLATRDAPGESGRGMVRDGGCRTEACSLMMGGGLAGGVATLVEVKEPLPLFSST